MATTLLPAAFLGQPYQAELIHQGGTPPVTWALLGPVPDGIEVGADGRIEGTPTRVGEYRLEARVEDADGNTARADLTLPVREGGGSTLVTLMGTCAQPTALMLMDGVQTLRGRLPSTPASDTPCPGSGELAVVYYRVELGQAAELRAAVVSEAEASIALVDGPSCAALPGADRCTRTLAVQLEAGVHQLAISGPPEAELGLTLELLGGEASMSDGTCSGPIVVDLSSGAATLTGNFEGAVDQQAGSCAFQAQPERVYALELTQAADLTIQASGGDANMYLRGGNCAQGNELGCDDFDPVYLPNVSPGTYYLMVEPRFDPSRSFTVTVRASAPTLPASNASCATAQAVAIPLGEQRQLNLDFRNVPLDPGVSTCGNPDVGLYYRIELDAPSALEIEETGSSLSVELIRGDCGVPERLGCEDYDGLCSPTLPPGSYTLRVAPRRGGLAQTSLTVVRRAARPVLTNDVCVDATPITSGMSLPVDINEASDDLSLPNCSASGSAEVFFSLDLAERSDVVAQIGGAGSTDLGIAMLSSDCAAPQVLTCNQRSYDPTRVYGVGPGRIHLVVQRTVTGNRTVFSCRDRSQVQGNLLVTATPSPPVPPNDTCTTTSSMSFPRGPNSIETLAGTLRGASNTFDQITCPSGSSSSVTLTPGPDVVYLVDIPVPGRVRVQMTPTSYEHVLSLVPVRCDNSVATACGRSGRLETPAALQPGQYWLRIDTETRGSPIDYNLDVTLLPP